MKYVTTGTNISASEVTDISKFGIWILTEGIEYFLSYELFPWFRDASVKDVFQLVDEGRGHLRWPKLDVDLSLEAIQNPGACPLVYEPESPYGKSTI